MNKLIDPRSAWRSLAQDQSSYVINLLFSFLFLFFSINLSAQSAAPLLDVKLEFNTTNQNYEVYMRADIDADPFALNLSQISIVTPAAESPADFSVDNSFLPSSTTWSIGPSLESPAADVDHDFIAFKINGGAIDLTPGVWQHLFTFSNTGGCVQDLRLFKNETDPAFNAPGMMNLFFSNYFFYINSGVFVDLYNGNLTGMSQVVFVDQTATGAGSGDNWQNAYTELRDALGNLDCWKTEVWVAEGTYKPDAMADRSAAFDLDGGISMYGGFIGGELEVSARLGLSQLTILSGNIGDAMLATDNSYQVIEARNTGAEPIVVDGFLIREGHANHPTTNRLKRGAGVYVNKSNFSISNTRIESNYSESNGGGFFALKSSISIDQVSSSNNTSGNHGGGYFLNQCDALLSDITATGNISMNRAGGMYLLNGSAICQRVIMQDNEAVRGGGIYCNNMMGEINQALITGNVASTFGSAMRIDASTIDIVNSTVVDNVLGSNDAAMTVNGNTSFVRVRNSILLNDGAEVNQLSGVIQAGFSNIEGGFPGSGIFDLDPMFVDIFDYHLDDLSPLLNLGLAFYAANIGDTDLDGNVRIVGSAIDLGVYENESGGVAPRKSKADVIAHVNIFPNPVQAYLNIELAEESSFAELYIFNQEGQVIATQRNITGMLTVQIDSYVPGTYYVALVNEKEVVTKTFIKI